MSAPAKRRLSKVIAVIVLGLFGFLSILLSATPQRAAAINTSSTLNFQARLLNSSGGIVPDGLYNIRFKIYDGGTQGAGAGTGQANSGTGGTYLWTESYYDTNGVTAGNDFRLNVINGYFNVNLGSQTAFSGINWDQELWMTMDIGGTTQTASPTYDGEMTNSNARIKLTGVPYAFSAGQIAKTNGTNRGTLSFNTVANNPTITLPDETGTVCTTAATGICTVAGTGFVQLQSGTPGTQQTGSLNISGTAIAATLLQSANLDAATSGALGIGNQGTATSVSICNSANCDTISLGTNTDADTINIGDDLDTIGITGTTITVTGKTSGSADTLVVSNSTSTGNIAVFKDNSSAVLTIADGGNITATGTYNTNTFTGTALTFGGASGLVSSSSGGLTIQAASGTVTLGSSTNLTATAGLTIASGGSSDLTLNSLSGTLKTGSNTSAILFTNSGAASIDATSTQTLLIGAANNAHNTTLGSTNASATTTVQAGNGISLSGDTTVAGTKTFTVNNGLTTLGAGLTETGAAVFNSNSSTGFVVNNSSSSKAVATVDTSGNQLVLGTGGASGITGGLKFNFTGVTGSISLVPLTPSSTNYTLNLPAENGTVCTSAASSNANCTNFAPSATNGYVQLAPTGVQADGTNNNSIFINKTSGTGNILELQKSASDVFTIGNTGNITATGTYNTNTFSSTALTFGGASGLVSSSSGGLTVQAASGTVTLGTSTNLTAAAGLTISSGGSADLTLNSLSGTLKTGSNTTAILFTNSGAATIDATSGQNLSLGTSASNHTTTLGSTNGTSTTIINGGSGGIKVSTLGSVTSNSQALCRDSSTTIITTCDSGSGGAPFIQNGNSFGAAAVLGTNDSNSLSFETNNATQATIAVGGATTFKNSADSVNAFSVQTTASASLLSVNTTEGYVINNGTVTPGNVVENPSFEATGSTDGTGWYTPGANQAITVSAANARSGNNELQITGNSSTHAVSTKFFAVRPGDTIYTEAYVKNSGGANGDAGTYLEFVDKDKGANTYSNNDTGLPGTSYVARVITTTVPASKYYVRLVASVKATATTGTFYFDDFYLKKVNEQAPLLITNVSTTAFQVQNTSGEAVLGVDSSNSKIFSTIGNGSGAVGFTFNTPSYTTSGAKLISAQNNGAEKFYVDKDGNVSIATGAKYQVNGTQISSADLSNDSNIAKLNGTGPQIFTGDNKFTGTVLTKLASATAFQVQNATNTVFAVDTSANKIILGTASALTGTIQFQGQGGNGTLTLVGPTTPNVGNYTLSLPAIASNDTVCTNTTQATACTNYAPSTGGNYLSRTTADTASIAAAGGTIYSFTNSSSAATGTVLSLDNGNNTGNTLKVTTSGNPGSGSALIFASNTNASAAGNLIDLQSGSSPTSKFSVTAAGNLTAAGTINTNTFGASALTFSGANPIIGASTTDTNVTLQANGVGTLLLNSTGAGTVSVGTSNSTAVNVGSTSTVTTIEGSSAAGGIIIGNSNNTHGIQIGAGATGTNTIVIGTTNSSSSLSLKAGTGNFTLDGASNTTYTLGASATTGTFALGGTSQTGTITLGKYDGTSTSTINIGAALNSAGTQAVNIATGTTGTGNTTVGNTGGGTTLIQSPTTTITGTTINLNAATIATNQATVALLQGATALNVGATTGTFSVRNANTTIGNAAGSGTFTNNGSTLNTTSALGDLAAGAIGTAAATVDVYTSFTISPTASGRTYTVPAPTGGAVGRVIYISNINATNTFTIGSTLFNTHSTGTLVYDGTGWNFAGMDGGSNNYIQNQSGSDQTTANFRISGTGRANTRFTSPFFDSISGALGIGDTAATAITVGNTTNTTSVLLQGGATATYTIGNTNTTGTITLGRYDGTSSNTISIGSALASAGTQVVDIGRGTTGTGNITIGNTGGGFTTIQSPTTNINSATVTTNASTFSLFDTNAGTTTLLNAATSITVGSTSAGTFKIRNPTITLGNAAGSGTVTNNGSLLNSTLAVLNDSDGGTLGGTPSGGLTAAQSVDIYSSISVFQTSTGQTITLPTPTSSSVYGRILYLSNIGSASFILGTGTIAAGTTATLVWSNTNGGASWQYAGADIPAISNQNGADQTANFRISGTGRANTRFVSPFFDSITGALGIGDTTATAITLGNTANAASILMQGTVGATYTIGTSTNTGGIVLGNSTAGNTIAIGNANSNNANQIINIGAGTPTGTGFTTIAIGNNVNGSGVTITAGSGNIALNSTNITTNQSTVHLFDTTATTATLLQAASTLGIGNNSGTVTFRNSNQILGASVGAGQLTNNGATLNSTLALSNFNYTGTGNTGSIGSAASTVDIYTSISIAQTQAPVQTLTIPTPTANTTYGRLIYISNIGTASFTLNSAILGPGSTATLVWSHTNGGDSWQIAGTDANSITNQTATDQTASFRISGTGQVNTKVTTPLVDSITGGLSIGTSTATSVTIGGTTNTTAVTLQGAANSTFTVGNVAGAGVLVNNGATLNSTLVVNNDSDGGTLGGTPSGGLTAAQSVDIYTSISINQTTASQTITLPTPTASTSYGRVLYISNIGTQAFIIGSVTIGPGQSGTLIWSNTNGAASWQYAGAGADSISNQNSTDQTANFRISGTGRANTKFTSPSFDSISGALGIGDTTATAINVGNTSNTTTITLKTSSGGSVVVGNSAGYGSLTNNGGTVNTTLALGNLAAGSIGTAGTTVDIYTSFSIAPTVANRAYTLPTPTASTAYGREIYVSNIASGANYFTISGIRIPPGSTGTLIWSNTSGGDSWQFAGAGGASIENQNSADQTATFRIAGTGTINVSSTTALQVQNGSGAAVVTVDTSGLILQIGSSTSNTGTAILALNNNNGTTTPTEVDGGMYYNNATSQFLCGENGFWVSCGVPPKDHSYDQYDEFMNGMGNAGIPTSVCTSPCQVLPTNTVGIGGLNWYNSLIGSPPSILGYYYNQTGGNAPTADANRPGILDIQQTGTGNNTGQTMSLGVASMKLGTSLIDLKTAVNITGGNLTVLIGLHNETTATTAPTTGVYWKEAANGAWNYCYVNGSNTETCASSGTNATAGTWYRLEIQVVSSTQVDFYLNGTKFSLTGITYNTTNKLAPAYTSYKTSGTPGTLDVYVDYFELLGTTTATR